MNDEQNIEPVDSWLHTATSALCDQARARIAAEIRAHYTDLVEAHIAEGMTLDDARLKALEDLGDAEVAARRFRKQHLTKKDDSAISRILKSFKLPFAWVLCFPIIMFMILHSGVITGGHRFGNEIAIGVAAFITYVVIPLIASTFARRVNGDCGITDALLSYIATTIAHQFFLIILLSVIYRSSGFHYWFIFAIFIPGWLRTFFDIWRNYRLWRKFRREQRWRSTGLQAS
jgi:hypothetical protein